MSNINLLPDDLKKNEEKEIQKISKRPKINKVEWNNPSPEGPINLYSDVPEESLWARIFGTNKSVAVPSPRPKVSMEPEIRAVESSKAGSNRDYSNIPKPPKAQVEVGKKFSFSDLLGPASSPLKSPSEFPMSSALQSTKKENKPLVKPKSSNRGAGDGWWDAFKSMLVPNKKDNNWKMAGDEKNYPSNNNGAMKTVFSENKNSKKLAGSDKSRPGKYHLAPKKEPSGININLIPEELISVRKPNSVSQIVSVLIVIVLASLVIGGLYYFIDLSQRRIDQEIAVEKAKLDQLNSELALYHEAQNQNYTMAKKILAMDKVLSNHLYWTRFFALLEKYTIDDVYYSSFSASASGKFALPVSAKDYSSALAQIAAFKQANDFAKDVQVDSMHILSDSKKGAYGVGFDLKINLADNVFKK